MQSQETHSNTGGLVALNVWLERTGVAPVTAWRWRRKGWLKPVNICGRLYLTQSAIEEFTRRAEAGEFSQVHKTPRRNRTGVCRA